MSNGKDGGGLNVRLAASESTQEPGPRPGTETPGVTAPWSCHLDALVVTMCALGLLAHPFDAPSTLIAVASTFLLGLYWALTIARPAEEAAFNRKTTWLCAAVICTLAGINVMRPAAGALHGAPAWPALPGLVALALAALFSLRLAPTPCSRLALLAIVTLNPYIAPVAGADAPAMAAVVLVLGACVLARSSRPRLAALAAGVAGGLSLVALAGLALLFRRAPGPPLPGEGGPGAGWRAMLMSGLPWAAGGWAIAAAVAFPLGFQEAPFAPATIGVAATLAMLSPCLQPAAPAYPSFEVVAMLLLVPRVLMSPSAPASGAFVALAMGLIVAYALLDLRHRVPRDGRDPGGTPGRTDRLRVALVLSLIGLLVIWPEVYGILARHAAHPWNYVHDVAMQVEEAMRFLLAGKDFYAQTYVHTPMVHWYASPAMSAALYHTDRTPFGIIGSLPAYLLAQATIGWYDQRFVYLPCLIACIAIVLRLPCPLRWRLTALVTIFLNPFFVPGLIYGEDDVLVLLLVLQCLRAVRGQKYRQAAVWIGLACATKHTALLMLPLFAILLMVRRRGNRPAAPLQDALREFWPAILVPAAICAPFIIWDARAFIDGNVGFLAGTVPHSYPIRGIGTYGFSAVVLLAGLVRSAQSYFPFTLFEALAALPVLAIAIARLRRDPTARELQALYGLLVFVAFFFSRFFQDSGLGYAVSALFLATALPAGDARPTALRNGAGYGYLLYGVNDRCGAHPPDRTPGPQAVRESA